MELKSVLKRAAVVAGFGAMSMVGADNVEAAASFQDNSLAGDFTVTLNVDAACSLTLPTDLDLGDYDFNTGASGTADITVDCNEGVVWELHFNGGVGNDWSLLHTDGTTTLDYTLEIGGSALSSDINTASYTHTSTLVAGSTAHTVTIDGSVSGGLAPIDGAYTDTVAVQLWY